jgi:hypothetical protein
MILHKESLRQLIKWSLNEYDLSIFLNLRSLNKYSYRIGTEEFNIALRKEKVILGKCTCIFIDTCMVCKKRYELKEKKVSAVSPNTPFLYFNRMLLMQCYRDKCKMRIIDSINKMTKESYLPLVIENNDVPVYIKNKKYKILFGNVNEEYLIKFKLIHKEEEEVFSWQELKEYISEIYIQKPFLMDTNWVNKVEKNNPGLKFNEKYTLCLKYYPS